MKASRIILWSAVTTIVGTWLAQKFKVRAPGFSR